MAAFVKAIAARTGAVVAMTGAIDLVSDAEKTWCIYNGRPEMAGSPARLPAVGPGGGLPGRQPTRDLVSLEAAAAAVCAMGLCGEIAYSRLGPLDGNATCRTYINDAMDRPGARHTGTRSPL